MSLEDVVERLAAIEEAQKAQSEQLAGIVDKLAEVLSAVEKGGGSKKSSGSHKKGSEKTLKPSVAKASHKKPPSSKGGKTKGGGSLKADKPGKAKGPKPKKKPKAEGDRPPLSPRDSAKMPEERKLTYYFGSRALTVAKPTEGYPDEEAAAEKPDKHLEIKWVHGFAGNKEDGFKSVTISADGTKLIYFIACFGVVYDIAEGTQQYFRGHSDDITCIAMNPNNSLVATGQKDPKDEPGKGKLLPNIYVWDHDTMETVGFLDNVCERKVLRVQFSAKTNFLYAVAGDDEQTLKSWDPETFDLSGKAEPKFETTTYKQEMFGFSVNPDPAEEHFDELVGFGKRQLTFMAITGDPDDGFTLNKTNISVSKFNKDGENAFLDVVFLPDGRYAASGASGRVYICRGTECLSGVECHPKPVGAVAVFSDEELVTVGHDETVRTWKICGEDKKKQLKALTESKVEVEDSDFCFRPKAMAAHPESRTIFVGSKTNQILQYKVDDDEKEPPKVIVDGHDGQIWGVACHPTENIFVTGGWDNAVKAWDSDTRKCIKTLEFPIEKGSKAGKKINQVAWSNDGSLILCGTEDSNLIAVSWPEFEFKGFTNIPPKSKSAPVEAVSYIRFSENDKLVAVAHMDANVYIFSVKHKDGEVELKQWHPLKQGTAPTHVRWSKDCSYLQSFTRDYEIQTWKIDVKKKKGKFDPFLPDPDKIEWAGDPLIAGWDVQGLFQKQCEWDGTDLNDASLSPDGDYIVSGDDYGYLRLHKYPAVDETACYVYPGHCEFVVGIEFLSTGDEVISCGGADMCVVQWTLAEGAEDSDE